MATAPLKTAANNNLPATGAFSITPHDSNLLAYSTRGIWAAGAGNVVVYFHDGTGPFTLALAAATLYPFSVSRVLSMGTTATGIIGFH